MKIGLITGASSGMGRQCVCQMAEKYRALDEIWVVARRRERLLELQKKVKTTIRIFVLDLCEKESWEKLSQSLKEVRPEIKILVNASGFGKMGNFEDGIIWEEADMVSLNCTALTAVTRLALPFMGKNSRIWQFCSAAAFLPQPGFAVYAATKAYVLSFSRALNQELKKRGIRVTAVCPGPVKTEFFHTACKGGLKIPVYKGLFMADPAKVVKKAIKDGEKGKALSIYGPFMKGFYMLTRILPPGLILPWLHTEDENR